MIYYAKSGAPHPGNMIAMDSAVSGIQYQHVHWIDLKIMYKIFIGWAVGTEPENILMPGWMTKSWK